MVVAVERADRPVRMDALTRRRLRARGHAARLPPIKRVVQAGLEPLRVPPVVRVVLSQLVEVAP
jgi:hypothetical protein